MKQHEINKTAIIIDVVGVVALLFMASRLHRLFQSSSKRNTTTARIKSQVCSARKPMTLPAALQMKPTIDLIRPGSAEAVFDPSVLSPFPKYFASFFKALVIAPRTAPIVAPAARKMAVTVTPYGSFSFHYLSSQQRKLFISSRHLFFSGFFIKFR